MPEVAESFNNSPEVADRMLEVANESVGKVGENLNLLDVDRIAAVAGAGRVGDFARVFGIMLLGGRVGGTFGGGFC